MKKYRPLYETTLSLAVNLLIVMVCFTIARLIFFAENYIVFETIGKKELLRMFSAGLIFDLSAVLYTNALYIFMMLLPLHYKEEALYQRIAKWIFVITNSIAVVANIADAVYFPFTNRRSTFSFFMEFKHESQAMNIAMNEIMQKWYLVLASIILICILIFLYRKPRREKIENYKLYYLTHFMVFCLSIYPIIGGMRGGFGRQVRPITISNASKYVSRPVETGLVLNTPFSVYQTLGKLSFPVPEYYAGPERAEMERLYSPVHMPSDSAVFRPLNVVVFIIESFGKEYSGYLNQDLEGGNYQGYTPFLDSLMKESLVFKHSYANGRKSIDAMPSILSGIPMMIESFFLTPYSLNQLSGIADELDKKGYHTSFFHGAKNGSMGFEAFAKASGYTEYFGRTEYDNEDDYDGYWGIWDEPFLQYYSKQLSTFRQPFASAVFTLSSHHPFIVPEHYKGVFPKGALPINQCTGYTDHAMRKFFESASKEPWFDNTLFVITGDHTSQSAFPEYVTEGGLFEVPIIFYRHGSDLRGLSEKIAQQIDIMPTVLGYLGFDLPYLSFGLDLMSTPEDKTFAVNYLNGTYQFIKGDYLLQFDGERTFAVYRYKTDRLLKENIVGQVPEQEDMERELKSFIQQYMERITTDQMVYKE